jgi:hypothetical protein
MSSADHSSLMFPDVMLRDCLTGKSVICLSSPVSKKIFVAVRRKSSPFLPHPGPSEGRIMIVSYVGLGCGGRGCAFDEQR